LSSYGQDSNAVGRSEENVLYIRKTNEDKISIFKFLKPDNIGIQFGPSLGFEKNKQSIFGSGYLSSFYVDNLNYYKVRIYAPVDSNQGTTGGASIVSTPIQRVSITFGIRAEYRIKNFLGINPELLFIGSGANLKEEYQSFSHSPSSNGGHVWYQEIHAYNFLNFILPVKLTANWLRLHPYIAFGPEVGLRLSSKRIVKVRELVGSAGMTDSMTKYGLPLASFNEHLSIPPFQAGAHLRIGLGYYLNKKWEAQLEVRDYIGITKLFHFASQNVRNNTYSISAGLTYHFNSPYLKRVRSAGRYNKHTGSKPPGPLLPQPFRYLVLQFNVGTSYTSHTHLQTIKRSTGEVVGLTVSYLRSINKTWLAEPYFKASKVNYSFYERGSTNYNDTLLPSFINNGVLFGSLTTGIDFLTYHERKSRIKPFVGFGASINQILQLYIDPVPDTSIINHSFGGGPDHTLNFYRIPFTLIKVMAGTFYRFKNSQYVRISLYVNHGLYPTKLMGYQYLNPNRTLMESGIVKTWNFGYGFSISYTFFNLNRLKKELKKEVKQK
jgi:hypothetical protein